MAPILSSDHESEVGKTVCRGDAGARIFTTADVMRGNGEMNQPIRSWHGGIAFGSAMTIQSQRADR